MSSNLKNIFCFVKARVLCSRNHNQSTLCVQNNRYVNTIRCNLPYTRSFSYTVNKSGNLSLQITAKLSHQFKLSRLFHCLQFYPYYQYHRLVLENVTPNEKKIRGPSFVVVSARHGQLVTMVTIVTNLPKTWRGMVLI